MKSDFLRYLAFAISLLPLNRPGCSGFSIPQAGCQPDGGGRRSISSSPLNNETRQEHCDGISAPVGFRLALLLAIPAYSTKLMRDSLSFLFNFEGWYGALRVF
jgi:hypothetical protein